MYVGADGGGSPSSLVKSILTSTAHRPRGGGAHEEVADLDLARDPAEGAPIRPTSRRGARAPRSARWPRSSPGRARDRPRRRPPSSRRRAGTPGTTSAAAAATPASGSRRSRRAAARGACTGASSACPPPGRACGCRTSGTPSRRGSARRMSTSSHDPPVPVPRDPGQEAPVPAVRGPGHPRARARHAAPPLSVKPSRGTDCATGARHK